MAEYGQPERKNNSSGIIILILAIIVWLIVYMIVAGSNGAVTDEDAQRLENDVDVLDEDGWIDDMDTLDDEESNPDGGLDTVDGTVMDPE